MKKILFALFLIILSANTYGQVSPLQAYDTTGTKRFLRLDTNGRLIISNTSFTVTGGATSANQTNGTQTTMITGSPNNYATWFSTAGTVKDSVLFGFTTRSVTFINDGVLTDTLFVSTSNSFPSTNTIKRLGGESFSKQWATTKLYFKVGTTPLASKKIRVEAN